MPYIRWSHEHSTAQCSPVNQPAFGSRKDWRQQTACRFEDISGDFRSCKSRISEDSYVEKRASTKCLIHDPVHGECLTLARPKAASEQSCMLASMKAFVLLSNIHLPIRHSITVEFSRDRNGSVSGDFPTFSTSHSAAFRDVELQSAILAALQC